MVSDISTAKNPEVSYILLKQARFRKTALPMKHMMPPRNTGKHVYLLFWLLRFIFISNCQRKACRRIYWILLVFSWCQTYMQNLKIGIFTHKELLIFKTGNTFILTYNLVQCNKIKHADLMRHNLSSKYMCWYLLQIKIQVVNEQWDI